MPSRPLDSPREGGAGSDSAPTGGSAPSAADTGGRPDPPPLPLPTPADWWWDGSGWLPASTCDRLWRWDGDAWKPAVTLPGEDPTACVAALDHHAEMLFVRAGEILATRRPQWACPEALAPVADEAHRLRAQIAAIELHLSSLAPGPTSPVSSIVQWLSGAHDERHSLVAELDRLRERSSELCSRLGHEAPQPSLKEADEVVAAARLARDLAIEVSSAAARIMTARAEHDQRVAAAHQRLTAARQAHAAAIAAAEEGVTRARAGREAALADARDRLRLLRMPGPGGLIAQLGGCRLHEHVLMTPEGRGPVLGAVVQLATAGRLWSRHQPRLRALLAVDSPGAMTFHNALLVGGTDPFLLVDTTLTAALLPLSAADRDAAMEFCRAASAATAAAEARAAETEALVASAQLDLERIAADHSAVEAALAERSRAEEDPALVGAIAAAAAALDATAEDTDDLEPARRELDVIIGRISTPPPPLVSPRTS